MMTTWAAPGNKYNIMPDRGVEDGCFQHEQSAMHASYSQEKECVQFREVGAA